MALATFQVLSCHVWLVAIILHSVDVISIIAEGSIEEHCSRIFWKGVVSASIFFLWMPQA